MAGTAGGAWTGSQLRARLRAVRPARMPAPGAGLTAAAASVAVLGVLACLLAGAAWLLGLQVAVTHAGAEGPGRLALGRPAAPAQVRAGDLVAFADPAARGALVTRRVVRAQAEGEQVLLDVQEGRDGARRVALALDGRVAVLVADPLGGPFATLLLAIAHRVWLPAAALTASLLLLVRSWWRTRARRARAPAGAGDGRRTDRPAAQVAVRRLLLVTVGVAGLVTFSASLAVAGFSAVFANTSSLSAASVFPPTGLAASSGANAQVPLSWNTLVGATDYRVQWRTNGTGGSWTATSWTTSTTTTVTGLTNGTTYEFQVQARNGSGSSAWSSSVTATPVFSLAVPTGLGVTSGLDAQLPVSWGAVSGAVDYQVQWRTNGSGSWTATGWTTSTSASLTGLTNNTTYEVQVQARDAGGTSGWSASITGTPRQWAQVSTGISHSCAVTVSGRAYCWGHNDAGQLGDGTFGVDRLLPVPVDTSTGLTTTNVASIAAGGEMWDGNSASTCAITTAGQVYCWGLNNYGQVGDGTYTRRLTPVPVDQSTGLTTAKQVSSGNGWVCAVSTGGQAFCWGHDYWGELGTASVSWSPRPAAVDTTTGLTTSNVASISAFAFSTCAVTTGGQGYCWGAGGSGALGNNSTNSSAVPAPVDTTTGLTTTNVAHISVGWAGACARTTGGQAYCWGDGEAGQIGNGSPWIPPASSPTTPVAVDTSTGLTTTNVARLGAGYWHTCAVTTSASAYCWGAGGTVGDGAGAGYGSPHAVDTSTGLAAGTVAAVDARGNAPCGLQTAAAGGTVFCWGPGGLIGDGTSAQRLSPATLATTPIPAAPASAPTGTATSSPQDGQVTVTWTALAGAGDYQVQWRTNGSGSWTATASTTGTSATVTGLNDTTTYEFQVRAHTAGGFGPWSSSVTAIPNGPPAAPGGLTASSGLETQVSLSWSAASGAVDYQVQWRTNGSGSWTATGWTTSTSTTVTGLSNNTVYEFQVHGRNAQGTGVWSASVTGTPRAWAQVSAGYHHTCAVTVSGRAYCWGQNDGGQLGDGTYGVDRSVPVPVDTSTGLTTTNVASISAGGDDWAGNKSHTCAVTTAGRAYCWGLNDYGQLGDGTQSMALTPLPVDTSTGLTTTNVSKIAAGNGTTCAVTTAGRAYCWGQNYWGELGDGTKNLRFLPNPVDTTTGLTTTNVASISTSYKQTCAVTTAGRAYCWGDNTVGQLGDGTTTERDYPTAVDTTTGLTATNVAQVSVGWQNTCARTTGGAAYCWGDDGYGEVGNNAFVLAPVTRPTAVDTTTGLTGVAQVTSGKFWNCAVSTSGKAYCWGWGDYGHLGSGTSTYYAQPHAVDTGTGLPATTVAGISAGDVVTCATTTAASGGTAYCWGAGSTGYVGDGTAGTDRLSPVALATTPVPAAPGSAPTGAVASSPQDGQVAVSWTALAGAGDYQVQWRTNGTGSWTATASTTGTSATVTGLNDTTTYEFQVRAHTAGGFGPWTSSVTAVPNGPPAAPGGLAASSGLNGQVPLSWSAASGAVDYQVQWRTNGSGSWASTGWTTSTSTTVTGLSNNTVYEFQVHGRNAQGTGVWSASVTGAPRQWAQVSAGWTHTCAVTVSGRAYCWGLDSYGQIGDGTSGLNRTNPVPVDTTTGLTTTNVASISAGYYHTCAVTTAGRAYCWGYNGNGAVGDNTWNNSRLTPTAVDTTTGLTTTNVASIRAGGYFTCAVTTAGAGYCWGSNVYGQSGSGSAGGSLLQPTAVSTSTGLTTTNVASVTVGGYHACAVTTAGQAYCWGHNPSGQIGDNTSGTDRPSPTPVSTATGLTTTNVARVAGGDVNTCAVTTGGQAYCWGDDTNGQIGDNASGTVRLTPTAVNTSTGLTTTNVSRISLGDLHACALTTGGQVYCWGRNANGQVGDATIGTDRLTPTAVSTSTGLTATNVGSIDLGGLDSCALTTAAAGGTLYCWGGQPNNQLGDGTNANATAPGTPLTTAIPAAPSGAPTGLAGTSNQNAQVPLTWSALSGAADYQVQWRTNGSGSWATTDSTTGTSMTVTGLTNNVTYEFQVRAHTAGGFGAWTSSVTATPSVVPTTPTGVAATAGKDSQVPVSWSAAAGATYYEVQWRTNGTGSWTTEVATTGLSYTVMGLTNGTTYEFQVHAGNVNGTSAWSASVTAAPAAPGAPVYQTGATSPAAAGTVNTVTAPASIANGDLLVAMITTNTAATGMSLGNAGSGAAWGAAKFTQACPTGGNNCAIWVFTKIASGESGNYTFSWTGSYRSVAAVVRVSGVNTAAAVEAWATGNSGTSGSPMANSVTTLGANRLLVALIGTDAKQTVTAGTSGMTGLSDNNNNVNGYTGAAFQAAQGGSGASGTKTFSIGGGVAWATTMLAATPAVLPVTPTGLAVTGGQTNQAAVSWSGVSGAVDYKVRYRVNGSGPWTPTSFLTGTSTTITGLSQGVTYEVQVKSRNSAGESAWSSSVTATP